MDPRELLPFVPELTVRDVDASLSFYVGALGFELVRREAGLLALDPSPFAVVAFEASAVLLERGSTEGEGAQRGGGLELRFLVSDLDALYERVLGGPVTVLREIGDRSYGLRDFTLSDVDGFRLRFARRL